MYRICKTCLPTIYLLDKEMCLIYHIKYIGTPKTLFLLFERVTDLSMKKNKKKNYNNSTPRQRVGQIIIIIIVPIIIFFKDNNYCYDNTIIRGACFFFIVSNVLVQPTM